MPTGIADKALKAIAKIKSQAQKKLAKQAKGVRKLLASKHEAIAALQDEAGYLVDLIAEITGVAPKAAKKKGKAAAAPKGTKKRKKRMTPEQKEKILQNIPKVVTGEASVLQILDGLGIQQSQWNNIRAAAKAAGIKLENTGSNKNPKWKIKK